MFSSPGIAISLTSSTACKYGYGKHAVDIQPEWILPLGKVSFPTPSLHPPLTPPDFLRLHRARHTLLLLHQSLHTILLPPPRHRTLPPQNLLHHHNLHLSLFVRSLFYQPLRLHPHLKRLGPPSRPPLRLHHHLPVLLLQRHHEHLHRHPTARAANSDSATTAAGMEG